MQAPEITRAVAAATSVASSLGLRSDAAVVLQSSNRLTLRLLPCDVVARVAPVGQEVAQLELELARRLVEAGCPVAALEPRVEPCVHERGGFVVTLWTYYESETPPSIPPAAYARALERLHAGMRTIEVPTPHVTHRLDEARQLLASRARTPALADVDRQVLRDCLRGLGDLVASGPGDQLLHGEPHPGNVLSPKGGPLFVDLETCCRGPVEFDVAHAPEEVAAHYPGLDPQLVRSCRVLVLAVATTWRWDRDDQLPHGRQLGTRWLDEIRSAVRRGVLENG